MESSQRKWHFIGCIGNCVRQGNGHVARNGQGRMMPARIEPGPIGSDLRTFEYPKCQHVLRTIVEDPMKSDVTGWLNGELGSEK